MEGLAEKELPRNMTIEWTELSYLQKQASKVEQFRDLRQNPFSAFVLGAVLVFFVLAGLYESWSLPLAVILVVPMCVLCAITGVAVRGMDNNIFTQIGFVVLVGLASKNAILIVEFAKRQREAGVPRSEATLQACQLRLRPIIMTSFAFILGVVPLMVSTGAGAEMRRTLGTAVFSGMLGVTLFGIFLTPIFFYVINHLAESHLLQTPFLRRTREISLHVVGLGLRALKRLNFRRTRADRLAMAIMKARIKVNGEQTLAQPDGGIRPAKTDMR
jgi:multidrug efflux pump